MDPLNIELFDWQDGFIYGPQKYGFLKSAWGTGKTLALILAGVNESETHPENLGVIFRKEFEDLRDSTIKDFEKYTGMTVNSSREVKIGTSTIMFRHLEEMNNLQNMNLGWFGIEQGEELETDDYFFKLLGRLRRENSGRRGFVIANANGHNWIYKIKQNGVVDEKTGERLDAHFAATTAEASATLPKDYLASLELMKRSKPSLYKRFVLNSDEEADVSDVVIQPSWVSVAARKDLIVRPPLRRIVSIDVARSNPGEGDKTVFYAIENFKQIGKEEHETRNTMEVVGRAMIFAKKMGGIKSFAVDEIGVGGGVADRLAELGGEDEERNQVIFVNSSEKSTGGGYYNRRAEIYGTGARMFEDGLVQIDPADDDLREQLSWAKFKTVKSNGVFIVEPKEDIKKRYKRSPDNADAFLNGIWALPRARVAVISDKYARAGRKASAGAVAVLG
jgi:hypothetical protein